MTEEMKTKSRNIITYGRAKPKIGAFLTFNVWTRFRKVDNHSIPCIELVIRLHETVMFPFGDKRGSSLFRKQNDVHQTEKYAVFEWYGFKTSKEAMSIASLPFRGKQEIKGNTGLQSKLYCRRNRKLIKHFTYDISPQREKCLYFGGVDEDQSLKYRVFILNNSIVVRDILLMKQYRNDDDSGKFAQTQWLFGVVFGNRENDPEYTSQMKECKGKLEKLSHNLSLNYEDSFEIVLIHNIALVQLKLELVDNIFRFKLISLEKFNPDNCQWLNEFKFFLPKSWSRYRKDFRFQISSPVQKHGKVNMIWFQNKLTWGNDFHSKPNTKGLDRIQTAILHQFQYQDFDKPGYEKGHNTNTLLLFRCFFDFPTAQHPSGNHDEVLYEGFKLNIATNTSHYVLENKSESTFSGVFEGDKMNLRLSQSKRILHFYDHGSSEVSEVRSNPEWHLHLLDTRTYEYRRMLLDPETTEENSNLKIMLYSDDRGNFVFQLTEPKQATQQAENQNQIFFSDPEEYQRRILWIKVGGYKFKNGKIFEP